MEQIADVVAKHGGLAPSVQYNFSSNFKKVIGLVFLNLTDSDSTIDELVKEIRKIKGVENVQALHPVTEGLVADYIFTRLLLAGDRAIILRRPGYAGLITGIREQFGTAGETFLYYTGYESGIKYGKAHQEIAAQLGIKDPIDIMQKISIPLCTCMGLGKPEIIEATVNPPRVIVRLYDSFECELGPLAKRPFSNFFRGILAGLVAHLFSRKMDAKELKCIAKGDPHCEFKITPE